VDVLKYVLNGVHLLFAVFIIATVLLQSGKSAGLSGSIAGGAETFFGKNKGGTIESKLSKATSICAIGFLVTSIVLFALLK
jgi:preprotein translocase subunit SecG